MLKMTPTKTQNTPSLALKSKSLKIKDSGQLSDSSISTVDSCFSTYSPKSTYSATIDIPDVSPRAFIRDNALLNTPVLKKLNTPSMKMHDWDLDKSSSWTSGIQSPMHDEKPLRQFERSPEDLKRIAMEKHEQKIKASKPMCVADVVFKPVSLNRIRTYDEPLTLKEKLLKIWEKIKFYFFKPAEYVYEDSLYEQDTSKDKALFKGYFSYLKDAFKKFMP